MNKQTTIINPILDSRWDQFVTRHPNGSIYHHSLWQEVIHKTYKYEPLYFVVQNNQNEILAAIPIFFVNSFFTGSRFVSLPFSDYCDVLFDQQQDLYLLLQAIQHRMEKLKVKYLEIKTLYSELSQTDFPFTQVDNSLNHVLKLGSTSEELFRSFHKSYIQRNIRKAKKSRLKVINGQSETDLKVFYNLLVMTRKKHGLPPQPFLYYANLWRFFKEKNLIRFFTAFEEELPVASILTVNFRDSVYFLYGGSNKNYLQNRPNHLLLWEAIKWSNKNGFKYFDFGRTSSDNEGLLKFKRNWGTTERPISCFFHTSGKHLNLLVNRSQNNGKYLKKIIRRTPSYFLKVGGGLLYKHLG